MDPEDRTLPDEFSPGDSFGKYEILKLIGVGGMARVYRARDPQTGKEVALKVMERSLLRSAAGRRRFLREGGTAASVKHSNVVAMLEVGSIEDLPFIVMELLRGRDLDTYIHMRGPMDESDVVALALPVVAGMAAVHRAGVVHRDIKPSNIFLATGDSGLAIPKLLDFGISKVHGGIFDADTRATGSREIIGTPAYLAPEALNGSRQLGPLSDQYSLGVVLYECLVGRSPYAGLSLLDLLQALGSGKLQSPKAVRVDISDALNAIVCRMLAAKPSERFDSIEEVGRALWLRAEEPARAIWASEFGAPGYTIPLTGAGQSAVSIGEGMVRSSSDRTLHAAASNSSSATGGRWWKPVLAVAVLLSFVVFGRMLSKREAHSTAAVKQSSAMPVVAQGRVISGLRASKIQQSEASARAGAPNSLAASNGRQPVAHSEGVAGGRSASEQMGPSPLADRVRGTLSATGEPDKESAQGGHRTGKAAKRGNRRSRKARRRRSRRPRAVAVAQPASPAPSSAASEELSGREDGDLSDLFGPRRKPRPSVRQERSRWGANDSPILD